MRVRMRVAEYRIIRRRWLPVVAALVLCLSVASAAHAAILTFSDDPTLPDQGEQLLVGVVIRGQEVGTFDVVRIGERILVPLDEFAEVTGATVTELDDGRFEIDTPLGTVLLETGDTLLIGGLRYLSQEALEVRLATPISFDEAEFSIVLDPPWRRPPEERPEAEAPMPDIAAPEATLSTIQSDLRQVFTDTDDQFTSNTLLAGRLANGRWRVRYDETLSDSRVLREYAWLHRRDNRLMLLGHQNLQPHPLLEGFQLTGAQMAWSNRGTDLFAVSAQPSELLPRQLQPTTTLSGDGPPGGVAVLRVDGRPVAAQTIGLDRTYEFLDVPLPSRQLSRLEVYVYDRTNLSVPIAIYEETQSTSDYLLPDGAVVVQGGAGRWGNYLQEQLFEDGADENEFAGFVQARAALSANLTIEGVAQRTPNSTQGLAGVVARLSSRSTASLGVAASENGWGSDGTFEYFGPPWRVLARSQYRSDGFRSTVSTEEWDHFVEWGWSRDLSLDLALVARSRKLGGETTEFLLPALGWRPTTRTSLRARPDVNGDYVVDLFHVFGNGHRLSANYQMRTAVDYTVPVGSSALFSVGADLGGDSPDLYRATYNWNSTGSRRISWFGGVFAGDGEVGGQAGVQAEVHPAALARLEISSDPLATAERGDTDYRVLIGLNLDLTVTGGRFFAGRGLADRLDRGAMAGRVVVNAPSSFPPFDLGDLNVALNGSIVARTSGDGSFFIGNLRPGIYMVSLDPEGLAIELQPERTAVAVEVADAATTRVDFVVRPELGLAGRVRTADGSPAAGVPIQAVDASGRVVSRDTSDQFGLYRVDGLPPGRYVIRTAPDWQAGSSGQTTVEVGADYRFGIDIVLGNPDP
jgi:hypothetical protein